MLYDFVNDVIYFTSLCVIRVILPTFEECRAVTTILLAFLCESVSEIYQSKPWHAKRSETMNHRKVILFIILKLLAIFVKIILPEQ